MKRMMREENIININIIETMRNKFKVVGQSLEITWGDWPHLLRGEDMVSNSWVPVSGNPLGRLVPSGVKSGPME